MPTETLLTFHADSGLSAVPSNLLPTHPGSSPATGASQPIRRGRAQSWTKEEPAYEVL